MAVRPPGRSVDATGRLKESTVTLMRYILGFLIALPIVLLLTVVAGVTGVVIAVLGCIALLVGAIHWARDRAHGH
jgi:hypothetical protein